MGFASIVGHTKQLQLLRCAMTANRLHHAYLFAGPEGVGKRLTALALAMALHCEKKSGDFCGDFAECARIGGSNHPDVRLIEPMDGKKEISIQQIREMEKELRFRSFSGGRKIVIIDPATLLNPASQNALLKTLEEPPQDSLLILITPSAGALLPTLRSRCLRLSFGPLPRESIAGYLLSKKGLESKEAKFLAALSMGSLGAALKMDGAELRERRGGWAGRLSGLAGGDYRGAMEAAEAFASSRDEALEFVAWAESWYRDLLVYAVRRDDESIVNLDLLPELERQAAPAALKRILALRSQAAHAARKIQRNLNRRMVLEQFLLGVVEGQ